MRRGAILGALVGVFAAMMAFAPGAWAVSGAISTTDNPTWTDSYDSYQNLACLNGNGINCNIYQDKRDVWFSGLPVEAALGDGTYYFAVLSPGGQPNPNDCAPAKANGDDANLSDTSPCITNNTGAGDTWRNRTFSVSGGTITYPAAGYPGAGYPGLHDFDAIDNKIQVFPYDNTPNPGGVYILAVCKLPSNATQPPDGPGADPRDCKYDAFKVAPANACTQNCGGGGNLTDLSVFKDAAPTFTRTYSWDTSKSVDKTEVDTTSGGNATFTYTVNATWSGPNDSGYDVKGTIMITNPNVTDFDGVGVSDQITYFDSVTKMDTPDPNVTCTIYDSGNNAVTSVDVPADSVVTLTYDCPFTTGTQPADMLETNTVTAAWDNSTYNTPDPSASWPVPFVWDNGDTGNPTVKDACATITDTFALTNSTGTPNTLGNVCQDGATTSSLWSNLSVSPPAYDQNTQTWSFVYPRTVTAPTGTCDQYTNTADFTTADNSLTEETSDSDASPTDDTDSVTVKVCGASDLQVNKTAGTSWTRTYNWKITKTANKTTYDQSSGMVTPTYTVTATEKEPPVDTNVGMTGTITLTNPNTWESITADVTDALDTTTNATCTITGGGTGVSVPAATSTSSPGSKTLNYSCSYPAGAAPSPTSGNNVATATWDSGTYFTPDGTKSGSVAYSFTPTLVNQKITPTDSFNGGTAVNLCTLQASTPCTLTATDPPAAATSQTYTYTRTISVTPDTCVTYPNTASSNYTGGPTANASVTVCGPVAGGLTMGFWQNKNGQGIIAQAKTGTCPSVAYLRQFSAFSDLSSTAMCGTVGSTSSSNVVGYVYNVIKNATCSSTTGTCNAMLKAQMLATALDVYFSGSTTTACGPVNCGGDAIAADNGGKTVFLGNVNVDLTDICAMVDGSSSSSCSGTYQSASAVFGGNACMTVLGALQYQNTVAAQTSPVATIPDISGAGTSWYGQYKPSQVLAKNVFDAINNQQAFSC